MNHFYKIDQQERQSSLEQVQPIVVFFGDSRAAAWTTPNLKTFKFINRGIGGQTSAQTLLRFDAQVRDLSPDIIVLQVGVNDLRMIPYPPKTRQDIIRNCQQNIEKIINKAQSIGATVIITTIFPLAKEEIPFNLKWVWEEADQIAQGIDEVNHYIRALEQPPNLKVFDAYKILEKQGKVQETYAEDLLHINAEGYKQLNQKLTQLFQEIKL
ncbi:SGNH/GDSL hydrolase family protein [Gloeothece verrucosa]|nr:GDSL-type esterase/lipase family protein [Gloeothece verrucosa]